MEKTALKNRHSKPRKCRKFYMCRSYRKTPKNIDISRNNKLLLTRSYFLFMKLSNKKSPFSALSALLKKSAAFIYLYLSLSLSLCCNFVALVLHQCCIATPHKQERKTLYFLSQCSIIKARGTTAPRGLTC